MIANPTISPTMTSSTQRTLISTSSAKCTVHSQVSDLLHMDESKETIQRITIPEKSSSPTTPDAASSSTTASTTPEATNPSNSVVVCQVFFTKKCDNERKKEHSDLKDSSKITISSSPLQMKQVETRHWVASENEPKMTDLTGLFPSSTDCELSETLLARNSNSCSMVVISLAGNIRSLVLHCQQCDVDLPGQTVRFPDISNAKKEKTKCSSCSMSLVHRFSGANHSQGEKNNESATASVFFKNFNGCSFEKVHKFPSQEWVVRKYFMCVICRISLPGLPEALSHMLGRRHSMAVAEIHRNVTQVDKSAQNSNGSSLSISGDLTDSLEVRLSKNCELCGAELKEGRKPKQHMKGNYHSSVEKEMTNDVVNSGEDPKFASRIILGTLDLQFHHCPGEALFVGRPYILQHLKSNSHNLKCTGIVELKKIKDGATKMCSLPACCNISYHTTRISPSTNSGRSLEGSQLTQLYKRFCGYDRVQRISEEMWAEYLRIESQFRPYCVGAIPSVEQRLVVAAYLNMDDPTPTCQPIE